MSDEPLNGYVFVFTGEMAMDREDAKARVLLLGARVTTTVSSKTTHLVVGEEPGPSKLEKAKSFGTKIFKENEFKDLIEKYNSKMDVMISTAGNTKPKKKNTTGVIPWVEKYRPSSPEDIVGNQSAFQQLCSYLLGETSFKAVLLSGAPGVGKTTAALAACKSLSFSPIEFNASDLRNKKALSETITPFTSGLSVNNEKKVIIMDEVDGMTSDRGGLPELINIIKKSKIPIICICNDKSHPKMRTLTNHCLDLHFRKLDFRSILPRVKYILEQEGKSLSDGIINEIVMNSNGDLRYVLNSIQNLVSKDMISLEYVNKSLVKKNVLKGTFEIAAELFQKKTISEKIDLYFEDYSLMPLFVHENYLKCSFKDPTDLLNCAESISMSDLIDSRIHGTEQEWSLMPYHAFFSIVYPLKNKGLQKRLDFPGYLGQNSKRGKNLRILNEILHHLKLKITSKPFRAFACELIYKKFINSLSNGDIDQCLKIIQELELLKDDVINIGEATGMDAMKSVNTKFKSQLTREYNKLNRVLPYSLLSGVNKEELEDE